jgi:glycosyltransferase involved in cell wall biosynthesis
MLRGITTLLAIAPASVHVLVVVDNPSVPLEPLRELEDWKHNHLVRIYQNPSNVGASQSRNTGIASSFGDWVVLLDDDVIPSKNLLDAYLGALLRNPDAMVMVGLTSLADPLTLLQHALKASQMTFFYDVANRMMNPPWGVTANICVRGRTSHGVWFSNDYPRTGGGEDVDYCLRIKDLYPFHTRNEVIVAVPEARAEHPFWNSISRQVIGWACGDVRCLSALPLKTFFAPPNWIEFIFLFAVFLVFLQCCSCSSAGLEDYLLWFVRYF